MHLESEITIQNAVIIACDQQNTQLRGDLQISDNRIVALGAHLPPAGRVIDAQSKLLLPGLIQAHVHLCQTSLRGQADDLELLPWLRQRIWPAEAAHTPESIAASARLGLAELLPSGVTTICTMETVRHTAVVFEVCRETGVRAVIGKALMDQGEGVPAALLQPADEALLELEELYQRFHGAEAGRLQCAVTPRFALSCSEVLLRGCAAFAQQRDLLIHTHASENPREVEAVRRATGRGNIAYLHDLGLVGKRSLLVHVVHPDPGELELIASSGAAIVHCPTANLKLGSGIAPLKQMLRLGIPVALGSDGAACNNTLDIWQEVKLAALLQSVSVAPGAASAREVLHAATLGGAQTLGLGAEIGSIEVGKKADLILIDCDQPHWQGAGDWASKIVYCGKAADVEWVMVDGKVLVSRI